MSSLPVTDADGYRDLILAGLRSRLPDLDVSPSSDAYHKAQAVGFVLEDLDSKRAWIARQVFPDEATSANLERHARQRGMTRRAATVAQGTLAFTGVDATPIPLGTVVARVDGVQYSTTAAATWDGGGNASAVAEAVEAGAVGNMLDTTVLDLVSPIPDVAATAAADGDFTSGTDEESDAELLARLLDHLQQPPAGGTANDWKQWALEVDGVLEAYVFPLRRGLGTVDVVVFSEGPGGDRATPSAGLLTTVDAYLDTVRPVTVKIYEVLAADEVPVDVDFTVLEVADGYVDVDVAAAAEAAVAAAFPALEPGETLYLTTHLHAVLSQVEGLLDYSLDAPVANQTATVDETTVEVLVAGTITGYVP